MAYSRVTDTFPEFAYYASYEKNGKVYHRGDPDYEKFKKDSRSREVFTRNNINKLKKSRKVSSEDLDYVMANMEFDNGNYSLENSKRGIGGKDSSQYTKYGSNKAKDLASQHEAIEKAAIHDVNTEKILRNAKPVNKKIKDTFLGQFVHMGSGGKESAEELSFMDPNMYKYAIKGAKQLRDESFKNLGVGEALEYGKEYDKLSKLSDNHTGGKIWRDEKTGELMTQTKDKNNKLVDSVLTFKDEDAKLKAEEAYQKSIENQKVRAVKKVSEFGSGVSAGAQVALQAISPTAKANYDMVHGKESSAALKAKFSRGVLGIDTPETRILTGETSWLHPVEKIASKRVQKKIERGNRNAANLKRARAAEYQRLNFSEDEEKEYPSRLSVRIDQYSEEQALRSLLDDESFELLDEQVKAEQEDFSETNPVKSMLKPEVTPQTISKETVEEDLTAAATLNEAKSNKTLEMKAIEDEIDPVTELLNTSFYIPDEKESAFQEKLCNGTGSFSEENDPYVSKLTQFADLAESLNMR